MLWYTMFKIDVFELSSTSTLIRGSSTCQSISTAVLVVFDLICTADTARVNFLLKTACSMDEQFEFLLLATTAEGG